MSLPAPTGPHGVGTFTTELTDFARPRHLLDATTGRRLRLQFWYPAPPATDAARPLAWEAVRREPQLPWLARGALALIRTRTWARQDASLASAGGAAAPLVYNHGFISFSAENTSLMEDLASHGRVVVAIQHLDQLPELQALQRAQPAADRERAQALTRRLMRASDADRAALAREYYTASATTSSIVMERAADTLFLLDHLDAALAAIPGWQASRGSTPARAHLAGFSLGGAVATAVALRDPRAISVINLDGGTQGPVDATALKVPYLMLYSQANRGINDLLLPAHAQHDSTEGTRHMNFHDLAGLAPWLKFTPALGRIAPSAFLGERNERVRRHLQATDG